MYKIFIVEDEPAIAEGLKKQLEGWGFSAAFAKDLKDIMPALRDFSPHLVIMDISLPFHNGFYWCKEIRRELKTPVLFLSSASDNMNIVTAMNLGGDDFVAKPFDFSVLLAKINAIMRRCYDYSKPAERPEHKGAVLDVSEAALFYNNEKIELTKNELRILQTLMQNIGKTVSRSELMKRLWETDCFVDENALSVNISRIRKRLEAAGLRDFITTKSGRGYVIE